MKRMSLTSYEIGAALVTAEALGTVQESKIRKKRKGVNRALNLKRRKRFVAKSNYETSSLPNIKYHTVFAIGEYLSRKLDLDKHSQEWFLAYLVRITQAGWLSGDYKDAKTFKTGEKSEFLRTENGIIFKKVLDETIEKFFASDGTIKEAPNEEEFFDHIIRNDLRISP
jgi:hypothetical protein